MGDFRRIRVNTLIQQVERFLLLGIYLCVCLITGISHSHAPDISFHDHCPACQWEIQNQDEDSCTNAIHEALLDPLVCIDKITIPLIQDEYHLFFPDSHHSRAPPASS